MLAAFSGLNEGVDSSSLTGSKDPATHSASATSNLTPTLGPMYVLKVRPAPTSESREILLDTNEQFLSVLFTDVKQTCRVYL